ncbi:MAG: glycoside hydrolase [Tannerella sp.]|jgi:hypothetical protein|nr:glycoside hydrolase [Tannerella sp.]
MNIKNLIFSAAVLSAILLSLLTAASCSSAKDKATMLPVNWNPKAEGDKVLARLIKVTADQVKGAHNSHFAIVDGYAYIVDEQNDVRPGETAFWDFQYISLSIVNIKTMKVEKTVPVAKQNQVFENETLPAGACLGQRVIRINPQILRCYFVSENPRKRQSQYYFVDFDLKTQTFSNRLNRVKLKTEDGIFDMQPQYVYQSAAKSGFKKKEDEFGFTLHDDPAKQFDGKTYVAFSNFITGLQGLGIWNETFDTVEIIGYFNEPQETTKLSEPAVNKLPDGTWLAICRNEMMPKNYLFTTSKDGTHWTEAASREFISNGDASKPTFDKFNGVYYIGWQESTRFNGVERSVFNIDISTDGEHWVRKYRFETEKSFQYPFFCEYGGHIWLSVTQGESGTQKRTQEDKKTQITFGMLE